MQFNKVRIVKVDSIYHVIGIDTRGRTYNLRFTSLEKANQYIKVHNKCKREVIRYAV